MKRKVITPLLLLAAGAGYYQWISVTDIRIPCLFRKLSGFLCPGCGVTALCISLLRFDFKAAFYANPFLLCTSPFLLFELVLAIRRGNRTPVWNRIMLTVYLILLMLFGIMRNLV